MNKKLTFLVAGGDLRQVYTAKALACEHTVYAAGFDKNVVDFEDIQLVDQSLNMPERADYIILPLPASNNGVFVNAPFCKHSIPLTELPSLLKDDGIILGGKLDARTLKIFDKCGIETVDYFEREELNVLNSIPTAEGAVQIAMEEMATTIFGKKILVTGFGRISKVLVRILNGLGADITVIARKYSDIAWADINGCKGMHVSQLDDVIDKFDLIFNTVPAIMLNEQRLNNVKKDVLIIDLASKPGGDDLILHNVQADMNITL